MMTVTAADDDTTHSFVRVFGGMGLDHRGEPTSIGGPRQQKLLALLAIRTGSAVEIDWITEHLWSDDDRPEATAPALRTYVSRLRSALPTEAQEWVETVPGGYRLSAPEQAVEHLRFATLRAAAKAARDREDPLAAHDLLGEALGLWRGSPFRELEEVEAARALIEQLEVDRLEMLEERWEAALALGRHTQITGELASFTRENGLRDRAARQYALALHRSGRTPEALRVLENHRRTIANETGLDPSPAVVELERALLAGDPSLDVDAAGRPLRGYRLIEEAGVGAFAVVWRGVQPSVDREVAIKQIRSELASQPEFIRRFEAEAHLVARIEHPHIVPLIDFWRDPDSAYLVMRWLRGGTLERRLDDGVLSLSATLVLARQIGGALSAAHAHGVIHRDVKPGNILFDEAGHAFLGDFGIALEATESAGPEAALSPGSPAYSAPEQTRREPLGPEADVFSLGVVLFECLTGSLPFGAMSGSDIVERQLGEPSPSLAELRSDVPTSVSDAVARATAKDPAERFSTVAEFVSALEPAAGDAMPQLDGDAENPYVGLQAFDDGDVDRFFGRERLVAELLDRLAGNTIRSRGVVVVGPSGSGKSSVVRAGLVPALRAGRVAGSDEWFTTTMVPGANPFEALEAALLRVAVNPPPTLLDQLRDGSRGVLRGVRRCLPDEGARLLLVIDQFEEVFSGSSAGDAGAFLDALAVAVTDPTSPLRLAATLRADFYDRPLAHPTFASVLKETAVDVTPLAPDELEQAIVEPARRQGVSFEPGLVARIAAEANGQPSPLPLLQYTLSELFDRRDGGLLTAAAYEEIGGLSGALAARAESIYAEADVRQRLALRRVFGSLTDPDAGTTDLRRRVLVADLGAGDDGSWVLEQLGRARLVTFDRDTATREPTVEVAHEALLREWPRLVDWLREDADLLRSVSEVGQAAATWDNGGREPSDLYRGGRLESALGLTLAAGERLRPIDREFVEASQAVAEAERRVETRRLKRLRRLVAATAAALVVALVAGGVALVQQRRADDEAQAATAAASEADAQRDVAESEAAAALAAIEQAELATLISRSAALSGEDSDLSVLLALEAHRRSPEPGTQQAILNALGSSDLPNRLSDLPALVDPDRACSVAVSSPRGTAEFSTSADGLLISRDSLTGEIVEHGRAPDPCVVWMASLERGYATAQTLDALRAWIGPLGGPLDVQVDFDEPTRFLPHSFDLVDRLPMVTFGETLSVTLLDVATGEVVGAPIVGGDELTSDMASEDGTLWAVSFGTQNTDDPDGTTIVVDAASGEERFRFASEQPAAAMAFDLEAGELIAAVFPNRLVTIDLDSGDAVASVQLPTTARPLEVGVRPDGLVTVVVAGEAMVVDRMTGATSSRKPLRDVLFAWYRPDGRLFATTAGDERTGVFDLDGNALIDRTIPIAPFTKTTFNDGLVSSIEVPTGSTVEVIDLASGERSVTELVTAEGERITPHTVYPDADGLWAIDIANVFTRWEGGRNVDRLDLGGEWYAGTRSGDRYAYVWGAPGAGPTDPQQVSLIEFDGGSVDVVFTVEVSGVAEAHPSADGGLFAIGFDGTLFHYDADGELIAELPTTAFGTDLITFDAASGLIAVATERGIVSIVDAETGETQTLPTLEPITNLGFGRDGELLVLTGADGTVRLWDVERGASGGVAWRGTGAVPGSPSWYDAETTTMWVASSGRLLNIPLDPARWIERGCEVVGRDLTQDEWNQFVPGDEDRQSACGRELVEEAEAAALSISGPELVIESTIDWTTEPASGTFEVVVGGDELGCSSGTTIESGGPNGIINEFTCVEGALQGSFTLQWQIIDGADGPGDVNGPWTVASSTGDFAGLVGEGLWSGIADGDTGVGTFDGTFDIVE